jgi:hypothetical protein
VGGLGFRVLRERERELLKRPKQNLKQQKTFHDLFINNSKKNWETGLSVRV